MGVITRIGDGIRSVFAARRTAPELETSRDRVIYLGQGSMAAGVYMTPDEALRLSAVWACVSVISKAIASCAWEVYEEDEEGNREMRRNTSTWRMLNLRPNDEMKPFDFRETALIQALVWGNFFAEIERDIAGRPVRLWPIAPERVKFERAEDNRLLVVVTNWDRQDTVLEYRDVFHLHGPGIDGVAGFDLVALAAQSLAHAKAAETFGASFYGNGTAMGGALLTDQKLGTEQIQDMRSEFEKRYKGANNAFRFLVLQGGLKYQSFSVAPEQAQFIETRQFMVEEVCRWFGVPPHKIAHLLRSTNNNIEHQGLEFVRDALVPWCERLRQEADWKLVPGSGRFLRTRIDTEWLSEGDAKSRAETDSILIQNGVMTHNEVRRRRGLNTIGPEGDQHFIQLNMTTVDRVGEDVPVLTE